MIFVTTGTELPFDRLIRAVDEWASDECVAGVFAQIGKNGWKPKHIEYCNFLLPKDYQERFLAAKLIVSHAGMGTILCALHHGKPILMLPRIAYLGEHRSEHQVATARRMMEFGGVNVASDEIELREMLSDPSRILETRRITRYASEDLIHGLRRFINEGCH